MKKILTFVCLSALFAGCNDKEEPHIKDYAVPEMADRTVLIYMAAENNLSDYAVDGRIPGTSIDGDLKQIKTGAYDLGNNNLLVFVDQADKNTLPYLARIADGEMRDSIPMETDLLTSDPATLERMMRTAVNDYPAREYALVLWGHASGWLIESDSVAYDPTPRAARRKAYGRDTGNNSASGSSGSWMNIPSMAKALANALQTRKLAYIFADCCHFQCAEVAYELRNVCDYIIASPAEIPAEGAPYQTIVPALFEPTTFWRSIVDRYFEQTSYGFKEPLSVVKTSEMETLAAATRQALYDTFSEAEDRYPDLSHLIHYYYVRYPFYDANDFMLRHASPNVYAEWKKALDSAVIYKTMTTTWMTNAPWGTYYSDFEVTEERYGGISMFVPSWSYQGSTNSTIQQMAWYNAAGLSAIGW